MKNKYLLLILLVIVFLANSCAIHKFSYVPNEFDKKAIDVAAHIDASIKPFNRNYTISDIRSPYYHDPHLRIFFTDVMSQVFSEIKTFDDHRDVDVLVIVHKLDLESRVWGVLWFPIVLLNAPYVKHRGIAEVEVQIYNHQSGLLITSYHRKADFVRWTGLSHGFLAGDDAASTALNNVMDEIKNAIYQDKDMLIAAKTSLPHSKQINDGLQGTESLVMDNSFFPDQDQTLGITDSTYNRFADDFKTTPYILDNRDSIKYGVTKIGNQFWMTENLKWLPVVHKPEYESHTQPAFYVYGYDGNDLSEAMNSENYSNYGVLYNWSAARIACPDGWRLPDDKDWLTLTEYLINDYPDINQHNLGKMLKSSRQVRSPKGEEHATRDHPRWDRSRRNFGEDRFGFSALPGGYRSFHSNSFRGFGEVGSWWSYSEASLNQASSKSIIYDSNQIINSYTPALAHLYYTPDYYQDKINKHPGTFKPTGLSVRCVLGRNPLGYYDNLEAIDEDYVETNMLYDLVNDPVIVQQKEPEKFDYLTFGVGYGLSYGGLGVQFERFFQERRVGVNAGIGYFPATENPDLSGSIFYSLGTKFFIIELNPYNFYLNFQIGTLAKYRTQYHEIEFLIGIGHNDNRFDNENVEDFNLYGPSVLFGYEVFSQSGLGFNFALGGGITIFGNNKNALPLYQLVPVFDLGIVFRRPID